MTERKNFKWYFLVGLAAIAVLTWLSVFEFEAHSGKLFLDVFDIGQGDSIFIQADNNQVLIDGGPDNSIIAKLGSVMPFWDHSLDALILTHPHADHLDGAFEVLKRYDVGMVIESGVNHSIPEYDAWHKLLQEKNVNVIIAKAGQRIYLSRETYLDILTPFNNFVGASPKNIHDAMVVTKLHYGSATALLMGDAEKPLEFQLLSSGINLKSDILKIGHHGSKTSTTDGFLKTVAPRFAVISVGRKNRYGHPHQEVIDHLRAYEVQTFRTDQDGDVRFISDGRSFSRAPLCNGFLSFFTCATP